MSLQNKNEWEKMFYKMVEEEWNDEEWVLMDLDGRKKLMSFIQELLSTREKEIAEEVEKMKRELEEISTDVVDSGITLNFIPLAKIKVLDEVLSILKH